MRSKDPELMRSICAFVDSYYRDHLVSPSINEIAKGVGIAKTTSYRYLVDMDARGMLKYNGRSIETVQTAKCTSGYFSAPLIGTVCCGSPETEEEFVEEYVSLPKSIFGDGSFYLLRASGDSMVDAGIEDGDLVVIRKQETANVGDIVVALNENNENTLKVYGGIDRDTRKHVLEYRNQEKYPDEVIFVKSLTVQGVARHVIKAL